MLFMQEFLLSYEIEGNDFVVAYIFPLPPTKSDKKFNILR